MTTEKNAAVNATIKLLAQRFPHAFAVLQVKRRPLKIGVFNDILAAAPDIDRKNLKRAMGVYCANPFYLGAILKGMPRVGLDGQPVGVVTVDETAAAITKAKNIVSAWRARHQAKEQAKVWAEALAKARAARLAKEAAASNSKAPVPPRTLDKVVIDERRLTSSMEGLRAAARARREQVNA